IYHDFLANKVLLYYYPHPSLSVFKRFLNRFLSYKYRFRAIEINKNQILKFKPDLLIINQGLNYNSVGLMEFAAIKNIAYITISQAVDESFWPSRNFRQKMIMGF